VLGVVYIATFFGSWSIAAIIWLALHVPMIVGIVSLPTFED
jgi:phosphohistidine swiveling domain-containing protein